MRPGHALLNFSLPWTPGETSHLAGHVALPVWGPTSATNCRLRVDAAVAPWRQYAHGLFEEQMFFLRTGARVAFYPHGVRGGGRYDCAAEVYILRAYFGKTRRLRHAADIPDADVVALSFVRCGVVSFSFSWVPMLWSLVPCREEISQALGVRRALCAEDP